ncbi:Nucleotide-diphospho-sugar transferase superfamily protein isoform 1 [Tritrichomonas foetus]|uniref:Nucleotide-diphospho-sugar transferase superfamily protein isoform 1 n=1 Tax=Tritrichomonas foetus TaxID=1144522 RepID=A0A1J4JJR2_9EUKA|nr:Nucleotide-diphospho-sugar transferase superfamily protein isoform 1 [Tritrichomonas foetus]|eukprot:OHS99398.1 Nucleotide-diphospho-sugar transferase superfamily protein isoform 1 [Tritrichomonas foetus]
MNQHSLAAANLFILIIFSSLYSFYANATSLTKTTSDRKNLILLSLYPPLENATNFLIPNSIEKGKFTILMVSYEDRINILRDSLLHIEKDTPKSLHELVIIWGSQMSILKKMLHQIQIKNYKITVVKNKLGQTVDYRWNYDVETPFIFSYDDDIRMDSNDIEFGFEIFKRHPKQIVGFLSRAIDTKKKEYTFETYPYHLILTGIAFLHKDMIALYNKYEGTYLRRYIRTNSNCEDIFLNFAVSNFTNLPPILVRRKFTNVGIGSGLSAKKKHVSIRNTCVKMFIQYFNGVPMPFSDVVYE